MATAFGQIVGLMMDFKSSRKSKSDDEYREFVEWLEKKRHSDIVQELAENNLLTRSVRLFLAESHDEVVRKLGTINDLLLGVASKIDGLSGIANAISPNTQISDQAINILREFVDSGGLVLCDVGYVSNSGTRLDILNVKTINIEDPRFLEDDMRSLCIHGLLIADVNSDGKNIWRLTRAATEFMAHIN